MRYALRTYEKVLRVDVEGELTFADTRAFYRLLDAIQKEGEIAEVIVNLKDLHVLDSTGLALLIMAFDTAKKAHQHISFIRPQPKVMAKLALAMPYNALTVTSA